MANPRAAALALNDLDPAVQDALRPERFTVSPGRRNLAKRDPGGLLWGARASWSDSRQTCASPTCVHPAFPFVFAGPTAHHRCASTGKGKDQAAQVLTAAFPYIRTFESSMEELLRLRRKLLRQTDDLEDACKATESGHNKKLVELNHTFQVGGEQLETIDKQRSRAAEAKDLIVFFGEFSKGVAPNTNIVLSSIQAATVARRLSTIARDVDLPGTEAARIGIEKYCEDLERDLLADFDTAYRAGNFLAMSVSRAWTSAACSYVIAH
ncbi:MAG: exocyst complex component Sec10-domain-containing protein, partial [Olpidium bornovanus]